MTVSPTRTGPIRIAVEDCELVQAGVSSMLQPYADRVRVVDTVLDATTEVDVVLSEDPATVRWSGRASGDRVLRRLAYTWMRSDDPDVLTKNLSADELVAALERAVASSDVPMREPGKLPCRLSQREADILALIGRGLSNDEIAGCLFVSINTVKSYVRTAYRKIGVERRTQAVLWMAQHQLPDPRHDQRSSA